MSEWVEIWINQLTVRTEKARKEYRSAVLKFIEIVGDLKLASLSDNSSSEFIKRCDADGLSRNSTRSYLHSQGFIPKITKIGYEGSIASQIWSTSKLPCRSETVMDYAW